MKQNGAELIAAERLRQMSQEGWTPEHDDQHTGEQLTAAAACYTMPEDVRKVFLADLWPWDTVYFKPGDRIRELTKAGALLAAEIDRIQRLNGTSGTKS